MADEFFRAISNITGSEKWFRYYTAADIASISGSSGSSTTDAQQSAEIDALQVENQTQDAELDGLQLSNASLDTRVDAAETRNAEQDDRLALAEEKNAYQDERLTIIDNEQDAQNSQIATLQEEVDDHSALLAELLAKVAVLEERSGGMVKSLKGITGTDGRATVALTGFNAAPVVTVSAIDTNTTDGIATLVQIESVTATAVVVRAWKSANILGLGVFSMNPAGAGVTVHVHVQEV